MSKKDKNKNAHGFIWGSEVITEDGEANIQSCYIGDKILTSDLVSEKYKRITNLRYKGKGKILKVITNLGYLLQGTPDIKVCIKNQEAIPLRELKKGDILIGRPTYDSSKLIVKELVAKELVVKEIVKYLEYVRIYNITVKDANLFFINGILIESL